MHTYNAPHLLEVRRLIKGTERVVTYDQIGGLTDYKVRDIPYNKRSICYAGQRKLLFGEIQFLMENLQLFDEGQERIVLYIGSAPGTHIVALSTMFPDVRFVLYDGRSHASALLTYARKHPERVDIHTGLYTADSTESGESLVGRCLLVSDIRNLSIGKVKIHKRELHPKQEGERFRIIGNDLDIQRDIVLALQPLACTLKFVLPWNPGTTTYLDGIIHVQSWAKRGSAETRLWCTAPYTDEREYDNKHYERSFAYYNTVVRRKYFDYLPETLDAMDGERMLNHVGHCHDCYSDMCTLTDYITMHPDNSLSDIMSMINDVLSRGIMVCSNIIARNYPNSKSGWKT